MPNTNEYTIKGTFQDLEDLRDGLLKLRETNYVSGDVEHYVKYSWAVTDAEKLLRTRARIAATVYRLFGVEVEEDPKYIEALAEAKKLKAELKALEEAEAARETEEV